MLLISTLGAHCLPEVAISPRLHSPVMAFVWVVKLCWVRISVSSGVSWQKRRAHMSLHFVLCFSDLFFGMYRPRCKNKTPLEIIMLEIRFSKPGGAWTTIRASRRFSLLWRADHQHYDSACLPISQTQHSGLEDNPARNSNIRCALVAWPWKADY